MPKATERGSLRSLFQESVFATPLARQSWPDRNEHNLPRRHAVDRASVDLQERWQNIRCHPSPALAGPSCGGCERRTHPSELSRLAYQADPHNPPQSQSSAPSKLDAGEVDSISAFLTPGDIHDDPARLEENAGQRLRRKLRPRNGITFDDTDKKGIASPISEMERLIAADPHNAEAIMPYWAGQS